jgi:peroxiredoxin/predicted 2-oxoglutarate/Fe(II)-dependent dioxygenase YbiX
MPFEPKPASDQGPLAIGERLCDLTFRDGGGQALSLYNNRLFGWPVVIHLATSPREAEPELVRLAERVRGFARTETRVMGITRGPAAENAALARRLKLPFPLLSDEDGLLHGAAGLGEGGAPRTLVFDAVLRLEREVADGEGASQAETALGHVEARFQSRRPTVIAAQAPALVIPNLIDSDHCRRLIEFWQRRLKLENVVTSQSASARVNPKTKIRADVPLLLGTPESDELLGVLARRLVPELSKAFNFEATRFEPFRVGCYDATEGGHFAAHRDNTNDATEHRRYALTLNLNTGEYEGGFLRLPEYGPQLYAPPPGGGVVFSCSLLHLATPVAKGRRFALIGFFWGEPEQPIFERSHAEMFPGGTEVNRIPL